MEFDPNIIATSGEIDLKKLVDRVDLNQIHKVNIGSTKKINTNQIVSKKILNSKAKNKDLICLVLADGNEKECVQMLLFAKNVAE